MAASMHFLSAVCLCWICLFKWNILVVICSISCSFLTLVCVKTVLYHIVISSEHIATHIVFFVSMVYRCILSALMAFRVTCLMNKWRPLTCFFLSLEIVDSALRISRSTLPMEARRSSLVDLFSALSSDGSVGEIASTCGVYAGSWRHRPNRLHQK